MASSLWKVRPRTKAVALTLSKATPKHSEAQKVMHLLPQSASVQRDGVLLSASLPPEQDWISWLPGFWVEGKTKALDHVSQLEPLVEIDGTARYDPRAWAPEAIVFLLFGGPRPHSRIDSIEGCLCL